MSLAVIAGLLLLLPEAASAAEPASRRTVVMISLDGFAGYYLDDPRADLPTLRALAREGARAESMIAVNPTVTWPNHATLVTGDYPGRHGVTGNNIYDRAARKKVTLISDPEWDADRILKSPTLYDLVRAAGGKTAALRWPVTRAARGLDLCLPDMTDDVTLLPFATPSLLARGKAAGIFGPKDFVPAEIDQHPQVSDESITRLAEMVLHEDHPRLLLVHLIDVDHVQHEAGPRSPAAYAAVHAADEFVRRIRDALQQEAGANGTLVVVSDHGFSPQEHQLLPNNVLQEIGLVKMAGAKALPGDVVNVSQGGADFIYLLAKNPEARAAAVSKIEEAFRRRPGVRRVLLPPEFAAYGLGDPATDGHVPDVVLLAEEGYSFGDTSNSAIPGQANPSAKEATATMPACRTCTPSSSPAGRACGAG